MSENEPLDDLEKLVTELRELAAPDSVEKENLANEFGDIVERLRQLPTYTELYHVVKNMDNRLQRIEDMVETVATEVGPIVAELAESPVIKMLTGGKKRG